MKIEAGMKLHIRKNLKQGLRIKYGVNREMEKMAGKEVTVKSVSDSAIYLVDICWTWSLSMFEEFNSWIKDILNKHKKWLQGDGGEKANLCGANLCGANLRCADLCGADLCGADLRGADLRGANLCGANLCCANLCGADLCGADLCGADLCGADLKCRGENYKLSRLITVSNIGSRNDTTYIYITQCKKIIIRCGCFYNLINEFEKAVKSTHDGTIFEKQYNAVIALARIYVE